MPAAWLRLPGITTETRAMLVRELGVLLEELAPDSSSVSSSEPLESSSDAPKVTRSATATAWAVGVTGVLVPLLWPSLFGNWGLVVNMTSVGLGFWIWSRSVRAGKPAHR